MRPLKCPCNISVFLSFICLFFSAVFCELDCDILDPVCRAKYRNGVRHTDARRKLNHKCNYQDIWLVPGRADASCTRPGAKKVLDINPNQVHIKPDVVRFPGCFTLEIKNVKVKDLPEALDNSFFAKAEYQWWNVKDFSNMKCQNASNNGCGGYGNNCFFCDVCESLTNLEQEEAEQSNTLAGQLKGINCPQRPGFYTFRKEFCFNDWSAFDADGDCEMDFLQGDRGDYKSALGSLQQVGYGSVIAKIRLAFNATGAILRKRQLKEEQIEETVAKELEERRRTWDVNNGQFDKFSQWYIEYRKNLWHKDDYLPWLLYENEISCLKLTFDVCERPPRRINYGGRNRYTCEN
ncbi:Protein CBG07012 [Caenorhabditis briggsae]|uniref:DUF7753 domain-containing protein n=2 Tax=Caenorhabditis briggsae TaxID=6238 RepID=A0AAE9DPB3_CAEBR|nr:Protein CBG07012 [Caenorhabditis briggsae]ULU08993.1 hypothetical protein L3Y34_019894 [Caenorhabditis briggsae]UMM20892.1 hypothetical protein L5515_015983 [Caenorhabditis briggsae]CAP27332.2 Protein CBG07012 [Caenorhabditis briggsae]